MLLSFGVKTRSFCLLTTGGAPIELKAYKFRIYPTMEQEGFFAKSFGCVRKHKMKSSSMKLLTFILFLEECSSYLCIIVLMGK
ncbi:MULTISPECIES: helix-turn-helix domain-containing protein [Staphylococcus]|uniref:helix-turn-helix domain-containing protein n=1 Tax=Staphylococcus TaxID=1279 RepID=UPI0021513D4E|nr:MULTISPECIES: helix-turn-helix domain-containing protein [Staphylococcus]MCR6087307.1 helix-turn-helix domain-containing protein [Staphylococcus aureus]MDI9232181.1 helix-turn-helix domain-containing protein [Staphylococcus caprae]